MPSKRSLEHVKRAITGFLAQTYPYKELIVLRTEGDFESDDFWSGCEVRGYQVPSGLSIGELRNIAIRLSRGSVIAHWDDDDFSHPDRLIRSMAAINDGVMLVGSSRVIFENEPKKAAEPDYIWLPQQWLFDGADFNPPPYIVGGTMVYRRALWERENFPDVNQGEDSRWQWKFSYPQWPVGFMHDLKDESLYIATISPDATSPKDTSGPGWRKL